MTPTTITPEQALADYQAARAAYCNAVDRQTVARQAAHRARLTETHHDGNVADAHQALREAGRRLLRCFMLSEERERWPRLTPERKGYIERMTMREVSPIVAMQHIGQLLDEVDALAAALAAAEARSAELEGALTGLGEEYEGGGWDFCTWSYHGEGRHSPACLRAQEALERPAPAEASV